MSAKILLLMLVFLGGGAAIIWAYAWFYNQRMQRALPTRRTPTIVEIDYRSETNRLVIAFPGQRARMEDVGDIGHVYFDAAGHVCRLELDPDRLTDFLQLHGPLEYATILELPDDRQTPRLAPPRRVR